MSFVLRLAAVLLIAVLAATIMVGLVVQPSATMSAPAPETTLLTTSPLPATNTTSGPSLVERSPFAESRGEFSRSAEPPPPEIEVRLAGIFKVGEEMRASLMIGGQNVVVRAGDETPAGTVASIEADAVVLEGSSSRRFEMFRSY